MSNKRIQTLFFTVILLLLFFGVATIFRPFFSILLWSSLLYVIFGPLYQSLARKINVQTVWGRIQKNILAAAFAILCVLVIVVPLGFVLVKLGSQMAGLIKLARKYMDTHQQLGLYQTERAKAFIQDLGLEKWLPYGLNLKAKLMEALNSVANLILHRTTMVIKNIGAFFLNLLFLIFTLFFFFVDGEYLLKLVTSAVPIRSDYVSKLVQKFKDTTTKLFLGYFLVAGYQALAAFIIFTVFKVQGAMVFAILIFFCSFIPMFGAAGIWVPLGLLKIISGVPIQGIVMMLLCLFFVSTMDNFLRPMFLKDRIKLHPLIIFFAIIGGLAAFGFNGLILGPLIVIFFFTVLDLFLAEHDLGRVRIDDQS